jgi:hypothetical protein
MNYDDIPKECVVCGSLRLPFCARTCIVRRTFFKKTSDFSAESWRNFLTGWRFAEAHMIEVDLDEDEKPRIPEGLPERDVDYVY